MSDFQQKRNKVRIQGWEGLTLPEALNSLLSVRVKGTTLDRPMVGCNIKTSSYADATVSIREAKQ